jgi:hypothetical protein
VRHQRVAVSRKTERGGHRVSHSSERLGVDDGGRDAALFESDAIGRTGRAARSSIAHRHDYRVALGAQLLQERLWTRNSGSWLAAPHDRARLELTLELVADAVQEQLCVRLRVIEEPEAQPSQACRAYSET